MPALAGLDNRRAKKEGRLSSHNYLDKALRERLATRYRDNIM